MRLSDAEKVNKLNLLDLLLLETENGTRTIFGEDLAKSVFQLALNTGEDVEPIRNAYFEYLDGIADVQMRRNIFRGKFLGTEVTKDQYEHIADGTFKGMFLGDYWKIAGYTWRIADFDYWFMNKNIDSNISSSDQLSNDHHLLIFPDEIFGLYKMNDEFTHSSGLLGTNFYKENGILTQELNNTVLPIFGNGHILYHYDYIPNAIASNVPSSGVLLKLYLDIATESMIFGTRNYSAMNSGNQIVFNATQSTSQLALLSVSRQFIIEKNNRSYWTRDTTKNAMMCIVNSIGTSDTIAIDREIGFRPIFAIKG